MTGTTNDTERDAILAALRAFIAQRPGLEFANYGDVSAYRSEQRSITTDRRHAEALLSYVATFRSIDAERLKAAFRDAYSGRLTLETYAKNPQTAYGRSDSSAQAYLPDQGSTCGYRLSYCTGQYWPTEYRRAACAVLASAIWNWWFDEVMPAPTGYRVESWGTWEGSRFVRMLGDVTITRADAEAALQRKGGQSYGVVTELRDGKSAGDWLRAKARREFGASIARRWFN